MPNINKLTTSFIKITSALDNLKNQDESNMYVSMLDEKELECLKYAQRLRTYTNRHLLASPMDANDERKPGKKTRGGGNNNVGGDDVLCQIQTPPKKSRTSLPPLSSRTTKCRMRVC